MEYQNKNAAGLDFNSEVILCRSCEGVGYHQCKELEDYHKNEYKYWTEVCEDCKGSGRQVKTIKTTYTPYKQKETE